MAKSLTASMTLTYGENTPSTNVPMRIPLSFTLAYAEQSTKIVHVAAAQTDFAINLDSVGSPKFLMVRTLDVDVDIKLSDTVDDVPSALSATSGWIMIINPDGQDISRILVTTPASPASGAHIEVLAFE